MMMYTHGAACYFHRALETELLEKNVVHEGRLKDLWGDKVLYDTLNQQIHFLYMKSAYKDGMSVHD
jgi:hypothetical protein